MDKEKALKLVEDLKNTIPWIGGDPGATAGVMQLLNELEEIIKGD